MKKNAETGENPMRKWNWLMRIARAAGTAVFVLLITLWTTGYIVNSYMETVVKQLGLPLETQPIALSGLWGTLWGADKPSGGDAQDEQYKATGTASEDAEASSPPAT